MTDGNTVEMRINFKNDRRNRKKNKKQKKKKNLRIL